MSAPKLDQGRLRLLLGVLAVVAVMTFWPRSKPNAPSTRAAAERGRRGTTGALEPEKVPTLVPREAEAKRLPGAGRNPFWFYVPPTRVPTPVPPTPTPLPMAGDPRFIGPMPIPPTPTPTPIIPPAIPYKLVGIFGPKDRPIVALEEGTRLINAREGDTVDGRFIVRKVNRESVDIAFTGLPPEITRRLPLVAPESGN